MSWTKPFFSFLVIFRNPVKVYTHVMNTDLETFETRTETATHGLGWWWESLLEELIDVKRRVDEEEEVSDVTTCDPCLTEVWRCLSGVAEGGVRYLGSQEDMTG